MWQLSVPDVTTRGLMSATYECIEVFLIVVALFALWRGGRRCSMFCSLL